jgi:hypothetical protein
MDEMSQEATASFRPRLRTGDKEKIKQEKLKQRFSDIAQAMIDDHNQMKSFVVSSFIYQSVRRVKKPLQTSDHVLGDSHGLVVKADGS